MAKIYKEGQGKWARGLLVFTIVAGALFGLAQLHESLPRGEKLYGLDYRFIVHGVLLIGAAYFAYWLFNRPKTADFLIDTESELKNKVTWPSQREEVSSSIVVVAAVAIIGAFIFALDFLFGQLSQLWYG